MLHRIRFAKHGLLGTAGAVALLTGLCIHAPALAATSQDNETLIDADEMASDQQHHLVTATGHVEIARGGYVLHADRVTYDTQSGIMHAEGHVAILMPNGDVEFAESEDVTGDMKQAFAEKSAILFQDNSRLIAQNSQRYDGRYLVANRGMYTSCNVCKENPDEPPLWQIRAEKVTHDNVEHDVYYHNATVDFAGVPVMYTPYLSMPDPTVDRRQGFLSPMPGYSPNIGNFIRIPYYVDISPDKDAIIAPTFSQKDIGQLGGQYRERFDKGYLQVDASMTYADLVSDSGVDEGKNWRGHMLGNFRYDLNDTWRAGTDVNFASDKSYLQRYHYSSADELTSRAYVEGFQGRNYAAVNGYYFEDLRPGTQAVQPIVLPEAEFSALGEPGQTWGGRWSLNGSSLMTTRDNVNQGADQQGPNTRRVSMAGGWDRQLISSSTGLVTNVSGLMRSDSYWADNVMYLDGTDNHYNNVLFSREFAQGNVISRYPMARNGGTYQELIEPIAAITVAPNVHVSAKQPIEDSQDVVFDETNLFSPNRFTGNDLIEGGSRATYGIRHAITGNDGARIDMFGGQSYDFSSNADLPELSGLRSGASDYVGRIEIVPAPWLDANYGFRLKESTLDPQRQYARITTGVPEFKPFARYLSGYVTEATGTVDQVEQLTIGSDSKFAKYWNLHTEHTQAFSPEPGPRGTSMTLSYADECYIFATTINQNDTNRADIHSGTSVLFHFFLRNIGGLHTDSTTSANFPTEFRQY
ncbi:MAG: LPS-assembly protein LptD [Alphaproteobacteria bacterium]|nr:LPS-assembly protein LptD [Alphaproteobacteria bacterium]